MFRLRRPAAQLVQQESANRNEVVQQQCLPDEDPKSDPVAETISPELDFSSLGFVVDAADVCTKNGSAGHSLSYDQTLAVEPNMNLNCDSELLSPVSSGDGFNGASCASDESEKPTKLLKDSSGALEASTSKVSAAALVRDIVHDVAHAEENSSEACGIRMDDENGFHVRRCLPISTRFDVSNQLVNTAVVDYSNSNAKEEHVQIVSVSGNDISVSESQNYAGVDTDVDDGLNSATHSGQSIRLSNGLSAEIQSFSVPVSSGDSFEIDLTGDPFPMENNDVDVAVSRDELNSAVVSGDAAEQHSPLSDMLNEIRLAGQYSSYTENQTQNSMPVLSLTASPLPNFNIGDDNLQAAESSSQVTSMPFMEMNNLIENCGQNSSIAELPTADGSDDTLLSCELDISEFPSEIIDEQLMRTDDSSGMVFDVSGALITDDDDEEDVDATVRKVLYKIIDSISGDAVLTGTSAFPDLADVIAEQDKLLPAVTLPAFMRGFLYIIDADDVELVEQTKLFFCSDENASFHEIRFEYSSCAKPIFLSKFFSAFDVTKTVVICRQLRPSSLILWALSASVPIVHPLLLTLTTNDDDDIFVNNESRETISPAKHWVENWLWGTHVALCRKNITDNFKIDGTSEQDVLWEKYFSLLYNSYPTETLKIVPRNRALFGGKHNKRLFHGWHVMFDCITPMPHAFTTLAGAKRQKLHAKKLINVLQAVCRDGDAVVSQFASIRQLVNLLVLPSHATVPNPLVIMLVLTDEQLHKWPMCDVKLLRQILCKASESSVDMKLFQCMQFIVVKPDFFESLLYRSYKTRHELCQFVAELWRNFCPVMLLKTTDIDRYLISAPAPTKTESTVPFAFDDEKSASSTGKYFKMTLDYILECLSTKYDGKCNNAALIRAVILDSLCSSSMPLRQFNAFCMQLTNYLLKQFNSYYNSAESLVDYLIGNAGRVGSATPDSADAGNNNNTNSNETCKIFAAISLCSSIVQAVHRSSRLKNNNNSLGAAKIACCVQMWQRLSIPQQVLEASLRPIGSSSIFFDADEQRKSADNKSDKPNSVNIASWDKYIVNMATVLFSSSLELLLVSSLTTTSPLIESDQQQKVRTEQLRNSNLDRFSLHIQAFSATVTLLIALPQRLMPSEKLKHLSFRCCNVLSLALAQKLSPAAAPAMTYVDLLHFLHSIDCHEFRVALCTNLMCARLQQQHNEVPSELSMLFSSSDENKKKSCAAKTGANLPALAVMLEKWFAFILQRWQWPTAHALQQHTTVELNNNNSTKIVFVPAVVLPKNDAEKSLAPAWSVGRRNIVSAKAENSTSSGGKKTILYNAHVAALHRQDYVLFMTILAHLFHHNDDFTTTKIVKDDVVVSCMPPESSRNITTTSRSLVADVKTVKTESPTNTKNVTHNDSSIALKPWTGKKQRRIRQAPKIQPQPQPTATNRRGAHVVQNNNNNNKITSAMPRNPMSSPHLRLLLRSVDESRYSLLHRALMSAEGFTQLLYNDNIANIMKACQVVEFLMQHDAVVDTLDVYNKSILFYAVKSRVRELLVIALKHVPDALVDIEATDDRNCCQRMQNKNLHCYADGIMQDAVMRGDERIQLMLIARQLDNDYLNGRIRREFCYDLALALALADGCVMASTSPGGDNNLNTGRELIVDIVRRMRMSITRTNTLRFCAWNLVEHAVIQAMFAQFENY